MDDIFARAWHEIVARPSGPMAVRFYLQPLMALVLAGRDGIRDAHRGRPPYFWALFTGHAPRRELVRDGWRAVGKIFVLAFALDTIYQLIVLKGLRPIEGLVVAAVLALVPYVLMRGPANRLARRLGSHPDSSARA